MVRDSKKFAESGGWGYAQFDRGAMAEKRRTLRLLSRRLDGCAEEVLLAECFSIGQLADLALDGLVETKHAPVGSGRHSVWIRINDRVRKAITE
jgi:hypothetical protein